MTFSEVLDDDEVVDAGGAAELVAVVVVVAGGGGRTRGRRGRPSIQITEDVDRDMLRM